MHLYILEILSSINLLNLLIGGNYVKTHILYKTMKSCTISLLQILDLALLSLNCLIFLFHFWNQRLAPCSLRNSSDPYVKPEKREKANSPKNDANSMRHTLNERTKKGDNSLKFRDIQM